MAKAIVTSKTERRAAYEPLYDIDPETGASIEVFYAGTRGTAGWSSQPGCLPDELPTGPFATSYKAYRDALERGQLPICRGLDHPRNGGIEGTLRRVTACR